MIKLLYKPFGLLLSALSAAAAGKLSKIVWAKLSGQDSAPSAKDEDRHWREIAAAAVVEGAVFSGTKSVVDRAGVNAFAKATGTWPR
jgi:hypothetical protein